MRKEGISVPTSKSFLELRCRPYLDHTLTGLANAGLSEVIIVGDAEEKLVRAEESVFRTAFERDVSFRAVSYCLDPGLGAHGVPWHARELIDDRTFIFCAGHDPQTVEHYDRLDNSKTDRTIVFSVYPYDPLTDRPAYTLPHYGLGVPAHPIVGDSSYIQLLEDTEFKINRVIETLVEEGRLTCVLCRTPPEFAHASA